MGESESLRAGVRLLLTAWFIGLGAAASAQTTALLIDSEVGDYVGAGVRETYIPPAATFTVSRNTHNGISVAVRGTGFWWYLDFSAPDDAPVAVGTYLAATRYPFTPFVGLDVSGNGRGCNELTGRYLVREVQYDSNGNVLRLAIDAEQHCEDLNDALFVGIRYNSTTEMDLFPGTTSRYSLAVSPPAHGIVTGAGLSCGSGHTACTTTFAAPSSAAITATAEDGYIFTGWTGGCSGGTSIRVNVNTVKECGATFDTTVPTAPRTLLIMNSTPGDYIGQGRTEIYMPANSRWTVRPYDGYDGATCNGVSIRLDGLAPTTSSNWALEFRAPAGELLQVGSYQNASRAAFRTSTPGLDIFGNGRGCNMLTGAFVVHEIAFDSRTGEVTSFSADFEQHCERSSAPALTGTVHYRATYEIDNSCEFADPFASLGGGTCYNGGWLPPGMPVPGGGDTTPAPPSPPPATGCTTPDPFAALGGGTCYNGGWLPPGMPIPGGGDTTPAPPSPPPATGCTTPDPFAALGGGTCYNGGWLPPGMSPIWVILYSPGTPTIGS